MSKTAVRRVVRIIEEYADCRDEIDLSKTAQEVYGLALEEALWSVKEAAWKLYGNAFWEAGIPALVKAVTDQVNTTLRDLGYDPTVIVRK